MPSPTTAIIGGGIAGLSAAWFLKNTGVHPTVFEASDHFGGKIISKRLEGCLLEGGPDSLLTEKPWALQLCRELGLEQELLPSNDAQRSFSILHNGHLHPFRLDVNYLFPKKSLPF